MIGEFYTPPMHRDLMSSGMPTWEFDPDMMGMGSMYGGFGLMGGMGMYNTNYLGGVRLQQNLNRDTFCILKHKERESGNHMWGFAKLALGVVGLSLLTSLFKGKKMPWFKKLFGKFSMPSRPVGTKTWYKPWTWLNKTSPTP